MRKYLMKFIVGLAVFTMLVGTSTIVQAADYCPSCGLRALNYSTEREEHSIRVYPCPLNEWGTNNDTRYDFFGILECYGCGYYKKDFLRSETYTTYCNGTDGPLSCVNSPY